VKYSFVIAVAFAISVLIMLIGGFIWHLSSTAEFSRKTNPPAKGAPARALEKPHAR
jgi:uncharacterized sodium:solute symporter family permease YidK